MKRGISLIVLVITIIVMIILAASVIISLNNVSIIDRANEAVSSNRILEVEQLATLKWSDLYLEGYRGTELVERLMDEMKEYGSEYEITVSDKGVSVTNKPVFETTIVDFKLKGIVLEGNKTAEEYHAATGNYPITLINAISIPRVTNAKVYVKRNGESDDKYVQREVMIYPETTRIMEVDGNIVAASSGTYVIIPNLYRDVSWRIKVVYECENGEIYYNVSEPTLKVCFVAGTKVYAENGLVNIEDIKEGMKVYSKNFVTGENELKEVLSVSESTLVTSTYRVCVNGQIIESTGSHPYYVKGKGFVAAEQLKAGDLLMDVDGNEVSITGIEIINNKNLITVYNINVDGNHNYFVGEDMLLVHNASCPS